MIKRWLTALVIISLVFLAGAMVGFRYRTLSILPTDTIRLRDTIKIYLPEYVERKIISTEVARLPLINWDFNLPQDITPDSVEVAIPIERAVYEEEDYRAVVEGFNPRLVEMTVYPEKTIINPITKKESGWDLSFGPTVCYGVTINGMAWCLGLGVTATYHF